MSKYSKFKQPLFIKYIKSLGNIVLLELLSLLLVFSFGAANAWTTPTSLTPNTVSTCSEQAVNFFFLTPYSARINPNPSQVGGTVQDVANDGFTALGLTYEVGKGLESEVNEWLNTDLCLIHRLWPTRTVENTLSSNYFGSVGSLVRAAHPLTCKDNTYQCQEIAGASDQQMDLWVDRIEERVLTAINDPVINSRMVPWPGRASILGAT